MPYPSTLDHLSSWIHIFAACIFVGGVLAHVMLVGGVIGKVPEGAARQEAREGARRRLRILVAHAIALLLLTGFFQLARYVATQDGVLQTGKGLALMFKILVAVLAFGAFLFAPFPQEGRPERVRLGRWFYLLAVLLGAAVILLSRYVR